MNKVNMFPLAEACGLRTIKTWCLIGTKSIPPDICYPCFCKPQNSAVDGKNGIGVINSEEELLERLSLGDKYLIQEYIDKEYEIDINGFSYNHGECVQINAVCRKIRDYPDRQSQYDVLEDISIYHNLDLNAIQKLVKSIGFEGLFSIEFMHKEECDYFLEINMRNDGANYLYTTAGYNYPFLWLLYGKNGVLDGAQVDMPQLRKPLYIMQWSDFSDVIHGRLSLFQWLRDFARTRAFFVLNWRDPKPFIFVIWQNVKLVLRKMHILK